MKVRHEPALISVEICSADWGARRAWFFSRPHLDKKDAGPEGLDLPVNEFDRITLAIKAPIFIREWWCSFRSHIVWARTSRADDLSFWQVYQYGYDPEIIEARARSFGQEGGQDSFRLGLPLTYMTSWSANTSRRDLELLISQARVDAAHLEPSIGSVALLSLAMNLSDAYEKEFMMKPPARRCSPSMQSPVGQESRLDGDFLTVVAKGIPLSLRAQMVRHRNLTVVSGLADLIQKITEADPLDQSEPIDVSASGAIASWRSLSEKRNCWIADGALWGPVLEEVNSLIGEGGRPPLPCDGGGCPFLGDNAARLQGKDPNPPCPLAANDFGARMTAPQAAAARSYCETKGASSAFWINEVEKINAI